MHPAPLVDIAPRPSRLIAVWIVLLAGLSVGVVAALPFEGWLLGAGMVVIAAWMGRALSRLAWRRDRSAVRLLRLDGDLHVQAVTSDARVLKGRVLPSTCVGAKVTTLVWRADGERLARTECLLPDSLPAEQLRRLRVQLRYGRSEDSDGVPASHA